MLQSYAVPTECMQGIFFNQPHYYGRKQKCYANFHSLPPQGEYYLFA